MKVPSSTQWHHTFTGLLFYRGDGSERCHVCGWRQYPSWYVGRPGVTTDDGWPERIPVCCDEHGAIALRQAV